MPISFETTPLRQATRSHVRYKLHSSGICYNDRRRSELKTPIQTQNLRTQSYRSYRSKHPIFGLVEEEQIYSFPDDEINEPQLWEEKQNVQNQAQNEIHNDPENNVTITTYQASLG